MTTDWFKREVGGPPTQQNPDGSVAVLYGDTSPDWVRLPEQLGGHPELVKKIFEADCPSCGEAGKRHMELETCFVAECRCRGFLWYR